MKTIDLYPIRGIGSNIQLFRVVTPGAHQFLRGNYKLANVTQHVQLQYSPPAWTEFQDQAAAKTHVLNGKSLAVFGLAGVGKSHFIRECVKALEEEGKRVVIIAKTI